MPQGPIQVSAAVRPNGSGKSGAPMQLDASGALLSGKGNKSLLAQGATTGKQVQSGTGRIAKVIVNTAASTAGGIYDSAATGVPGAGTLVFAIPQTVGIYDVDFPLALGLNLVVGTGGSVSISYQ